MNILDSNFSVLENCFLEASAGTGKTFAIEQLIARLLLEGSFQMEEILAVTFTRAAARDMRARIRANLEKLSQGWMPPYRQALHDKGKAIEVEESIKQALLYFDKAQVFTIHGFCQRILQNLLLRGVLLLKGKTLEQNILCEKLSANFCEVDCRV